MEKESSNNLPLASGVRIHLHCQHRTEKRGGGQGEVAIWWVVGTAGKISRCADFSSALKEEVYFHGKNVTRQFKPWQTVSDRLWIGREPWMSLHATGLWSLARLIRRRFEKREKVEGCARDCKS